MAMRYDLRVGPHRTAAAAGLTGQRILVVSPQRWNHIALSKHHYASELARRGNDVFFLGPPEAGSLRTEVDVARLDDVEGLAVVDWTVPFPLSLRFHARGIYDLLMARALRRLRASLGGELDAVWCFDLNLYSNLRKFGARRAIYFPVDPVSERYQVRPGETADLILSVSDSILSSFDGVKAPKSRLGHGLAEAFVDVAPSAPAPPDARLRVGYVGNLGHPALDRDVLTDAIRRLPDVEFHLWGPGALHGDVSARWRAFPNVVLRGVVPTRVLACEVQAMDAFLVAYRADRSYDCSNSHKILEYLSTGRVVVATHLSEYAGRHDLLLMTAPGDSSRLPALLADVLARRSLHNAPSRQRQRRAYALDHTYARQLDRIAGLLPVGE